MAVMTAMALFARSQDSVLSVPRRRVYVVFSTAGCKNGGKSCHKIRGTAALQRGTQKASRVLSRARTKAISAIVCGFTH